MPKSTEASTEDSSVEPSLLYDSSPPISNNPPNKGPAQMYYEQHNRELKILIAMCRGTTDDGGNALFSESERPWKGMKISTYRPSAGQYKSEILRRANLAASEEGDDTPIVLPRPAQWGLTKILRWLDNHPITDPFDRKFLKKVLEEFKGDAMLDQSEKLRESDQIEKKWTGKVPYLRLIHALADKDKVKDAFIKRHDIRPGGIVIEKRNSNDKEPSVWELMADYWNDPSF